MKSFFPGKSANGMRAVAAAALVAVIAQAHANPAADAQAQQASGTPDPDMLLTLKAKYPATKFRSVSTTELPGIYEVVMGKNVAYTDQSGRYFLFGHLYDMRTQTDMTAERAEDAGRIDTDDLVLADAIKQVKGNGARTLYVFSDPDCSFCRQLEKNLQALDNVTIYTFMYPLQGLHPEAKSKSVSVWCAADRAQAWRNLMESGSIAANPKLDCAHPVDRNIALGEALGISGTPTMISADGRRLPGAADAGRISVWLDNIPTETASAAAPGRAAVVDAQ